MDILQKVYLEVSKMHGIEEYPPKFLLLQKSFTKEGALQEKMNELKCVSENAERNKIQEKILEEHNFRFGHCSKTDSLITFFLEGIQRNNIDETVLYFHVLDNAIANNIQNSEIMAQLLQELQEKTSKFSESLQLLVMDSKRREQVELSRKELTVVKQKWNNAALSLRHLWREISLLYSSGNREEFEDLPKWAAFYLIAGKP